MPASESKLPSRSPDTRLRIVTLAQELIQVRGYNAFSYQDLSDRLKIRKASIHHHFPSKEDLGAEVIEGANARFEKWALDLSPDLTAEQRLVLFTERVSFWAKSRDRICLAGICAAEWNTLPDKMRQEAERYLATRKSWLVETLEDGRKSGEFSKSDTVENQAMLLLSAIQGALQLARSMDKPALFQTVMHQIVAMIRK